MRVAGDLGLSFVAGDDHEARKRLATYVVDNMLVTLQPFAGKNVDIQIMWDATGDNPNG